MQTNHSYRDFVFVFLEKDLKFNQDFFCPLNYFLEFDILSKIKHIQYVKS